MLTGLHLVEADNFLGIPWVAISFTCHHGIGMGHDYFCGSRMGQE